MKYLLFSDLHLGIHNNTETWLDSSLELALEMATVALENNIKNIVCLGDVFNDRKSLNVKTINYAFEFFNILGKNIENIFIITGNHDIYLKNSLEINSLNILKDKFKNVKIIESCLNIDNNIYLSPWLESIPNKNGILMGHFEINDIVANMPNLNNAYSISDFKNFDLVLSGHYHTPSQKDNINYIGSCMPFTFADVNSPRGFYIFDSDTLNLDFFEFNKCPKYKKVLLNNYNKNDITNNIVKVIVEENLSDIDLDKKLAELKILNPLEIQLEFLLKKEIDNIQNETTSLEISTQKDIFKSYIENINIPNNLNKNMLISIANKLIENEFQN